MYVSTQEFRSIASKHMVLADSDAKTPLKIEEKQSIANFKITYKKGFELHAFLFVLEILKAYETTVDTDMVTIEDLLY